MPRTRKPAQTGDAPFWRIGLYIRLSREDETEGESRSLGNQEKILRDYVDRCFAPGTFAVVGVFSDDGRTGTDTDRPAFRRLSDCIARREVNCMIVKSLARGFRNLADQQKFLEEFIPAHGARFICTGTPFIDTYADPRSAGGLEIPIRGMFNEQFAAATSEEIRKTFRMKRERGAFIGAFAPYGYRKDPADKNRLLVDEKAARVVRCIFHWFVREGWSKQGIARRLNARGEPSPQAYKRSCGLLYRNPNARQESGLWSAGSVARILQNEVYAGVMVQGRQRIISYKVHKQIAVPRAEWFTVPDTHESIVDRATFDAAQALHRRDTRAAPGSGQLHLFSGLVRCADCRRAMRRKTARGIAYYACRSYTDQKVCSRHTIRQDRLEQALLSTLRPLIAGVPDLPAVLECIRRAPAHSGERARLAQAARQAQTQRQQRLAASDALYLDWKNGDLTREEYLRLKERFAAQLAQLDAQLSGLRAEARAVAEDDPYLTDFLQEHTIRSLRRGLLIALVDTIWVHEDGALTIDLRFADSAAGQTPAD